MRAGGLQSFRSRLQGHRGRGAHNAPALSGSDAADTWNGPLPVHNYLREGPKAMAGSPDAGRLGGRVRRPTASRRLAYGFRTSFENHERQTKCSISIVCNLTGVAAS